MRWYFGGKMMSQLGPLRKHGKCLTEMNVVYKTADSSSFLPDIPSHLWLNLFRVLSLLVYERIIYFKLNSLPKFCLTTIFVVICYFNFTCNKCVFKRVIVRFSLVLLAHFQHFHLITSSRRAQGTISWTKLLLCVQDSDGDQVILEWGSSSCQRGRAARSISRSLGGSCGTAGGRDGCLEVTSEQRDEAQREKKTVGRWMVEIDRWRQRCEEDKNTGGEERGERGCILVWGFVEEVKGLFFFLTPFSLTSVLKLKITQLKPV